MKKYLAIILLIFTVCLTGCFTSNPDDIRAFRKPHDIDVTMKEYFLQPADVIHISCSVVPELHNQSQIIRPDGKISFEMIGEIQASGKTPAELSEDIRQKVILLYNLTDEKPVDIFISTYQSKYFYVLGQVQSPGPKLCSGRDSAIKAINLAQPNILAWKERIQIIRPSSNIKIEPAIFEMNYSRVMAHGDETKDVLLEEGDIIYVPPTVLGWLALKVEELINPITRTFSGIYTVRRSTSSNDRDFR